MAQVVHAYCVTVLFQINKVLLAFHSLLHYTDYPGNWLVGAQLFECKKKFIYTVAILPSIFLISKGLRMNDFASRGAPASQTQSDVGVGSQNVGDMDRPVTIPETNIILKGQSPC